MLESQAACVPTKPTATSIVVVASSEDSAVTLSHSEMTWFECRGALANTLDTTAFPAAVSVDSWNST